MSNIINKHISDKKDNDDITEYSETEDDTTEYSETEDDTTDYSETEDDTTDYSETEDDSSDCSEIKYDDIYVISIDDKPYFYELTLSDAKNKILNVSKKINKKINENELYDSYICHKKDDEITIFNQLDFILFTKRYVLHTLKFHKIRKN